MQIIQNIFTYIIDMGASVMMPIIFTIIGLIMGIKFGEAIRAGMTFGVVIADSEKSGADGPARLISNEVLNLLLQHRCLVNA